MIPNRKIILLGSLLFLLVSCGETEPKRRTVGYKGEARANSFLAAQRLLRIQGEEIISKEGIGKLDNEVSTIFLPPSSLNTVGTAKRLLKWVASGGHVVVMIEGGEKWGNDFEQVKSSPPDKDKKTSQGLVYLLKELNVEMVNSADESPRSSRVTLDKDDWEAILEKDRVLLDSEKLSYSMGQENLTIHHWASQSLEYTLKNETEYGTDPEGKKHHYLSLLYGDGLVNLLTDARPLRNRYIGYADHAAFLKQLVDQSRSGTVVFSNGKGDSLLSLVWRYFWMAVVGLLFTIIFWLWKNLPRFGPEQDLTEGGMREFSGQVRGIGRFLWRHQRDDVMLQVLRNSISRHLSNRPGENHEGIFGQLAERTALPEEIIIEAMTREQIREPSVMVRVVKNLQIILKHIN